MQKDFHYYLTYALAHSLGIKDAEKIAWADQYTDDLTKADLYGIQTQSTTLGNWSDRQIQLSVLVPFHFIPGESWLVTANNKLSRILTETAANPFEFGVALHGLQDTFSHQGFSGWQEKANACWPWYYIQSPIPNIGHAEMGPIPDIINAVWTDPRSGEKIDNKIRAMRAAQATCEFLIQYSDAHNDWPAIHETLEPIFKMSYDDRKRELINLADTPRYKEVKTYKKDFIEAARKHLANFFLLLENRDA